MINRSIAGKNIRSISHFVIFILIVILFGLKYADAANPYRALDKSYEKANQTTFYLNLDGLNSNNQGLLFDINDVKSGLTTINKTIGIKLVYYKESNYDADNDGIESLSGVIDFAVLSDFSWDVNKNNLCTRWEIYSLEDNKLSTVCYGNDKCCKFAGLDSGRSDWNAVMYLTYGMHGSTANNIVSAQVIYLDYNLSKESPYSEIYYSRWKSLPAAFNGNGNAASAKNLSIEDALKNIQRIRNKNKEIRKIELKDKNGSESKEISSDKNVSMIFNISNEIIVSINNFNAKGADWSRSDSIDVTTKNDELSKSLKEIGISPRELVSVHGIKNFLDNESYYGTVKLSAAEPFNRVIYCPDDKINSCHTIPICLHKFEGSECYTKNNTILTVYIPHFSSIIIALYNITLNLTINSPDNSSALQSAENARLNFTVNETVNANYSLDNKIIISLGSGTSFASLLNATLPYGVLGNGQHNLSIYLAYSLDNSAIFNYSFQVNDTAAPSISINITNNSIFNATSAIFPVNISSNEYANITYKLNDNNFSNSIDLGSSKSSIIILNPAGGQNNLTINVSDNNYNSKTSYFSFNFSILKTPSCYNVIQDGDESGIDCGGACSACIGFNVTTDKASYNLTDNVLLTVLSRANSTVNVTITRQNVITYMHTFIPMFTGSALFEMRYIGNTSIAGNYTINALMRYMNITEYKNTSFEIIGQSSNPLSVTINSNATTINEGDSIAFGSSISGNSNDVSYKWDFQNDGIIDSTSQTINYTYGSNGTFIANLTVTDSKWNQSDMKIINVRKVYNVTFLVKDNETSNPIQNAEVRFDDETKNTTSDGTLSYVKTAGTYSLLVQKPDYISFSNNTQINANTVLEVSLIHGDNTAPSIEIISPQDNKTTSNTSIYFKYKSFDKSAMTCKLYANYNSSLWKVESSDANVIPETESSFLLKNLKNGTYEWKIECMDRNGNSNFSAAYSLTIDTSLIDNELSVDLNEQDKNADEINSQIDFAIADLGVLGTDEKEAAEAMQLRKALERSKTNIQRANRDLHSLKWRRLNATELELETKKILDRIEDVKNTTPKTIKVIEKNEFVKYPNKDDIAQALQVLINSTNLKFSRKELNNLVEENHKLQSTLIVTTKIKVIDVDYISAEKKTLTLIQKSVNSQKESDDILFFEVIPKDIASNIADIVFLFDYDVVKEDPIIKIDTKKIKEFSYYVNKKVSQMDSEKTKSILLSKNLKSKSQSSISGFASLGGISSALINTSDTRLIIESAIIAILVIVFAYYQLKNSEIFINLLRGKDVNEIKKLIDSASASLNKNDYENACLVYKNINLKFNAMDKKKKDIIKSSVIDLLNRINMLYINQLSEKADNFLKSENKKEAYRIYSQIQSLYKIISRDYKAEVSKKCMQLYKKLSE